MLHKMLFDTRLGEWLLSQLEQHAGLAVVEADWLGDQRGGPAGEDGTQPGVTIGAVPMVEATSARAGNPDN